MKKKVSFSIAVIFILIGFLCVLSYNTLRINYLFFQVKLHNDNMSQAMPYMKELANSNSGVDICISDLSICFGQTRGLSSWVIRNAEDADYAITRLRALVDIENTKNDVLVEAYLLIWEMAKDRDALDKIFTILSDEAKISSNNDKNILLVFSRGALCGKVRDSRQEEFIEKYQNGSLWMLSSDEFIDHFDN